MSTDLHTLSGAYALDALSADEAAEFERHLDGCEACCDEVRELREAAARMGAAEALRPPPALRARILASADQMAQLPPKVTPIEMARSRTRSWATRLVAAAVVAVLMVGAGFGIRAMQQPEDAATVAVSSVFEASDAQQATLDSSQGPLSIATSRKLGRVAVKTQELERLSDRQVYQMWTVRDGMATSAGLLEDLDAGKVMAAPSAGTTVAITIEPAGGSRLPTSDPLVELDPQQI